MDCSKPGLPVFHHHPELAQTHVHWVKDASKLLIHCRPLLLLPSIFPSIRVFSNESVLCIRWPKYWSFSFSISLSNEDSRLMSFRTDWLDFLVVQGALKSFFQCHSSKACSLALSLLYGPTLTSKHDSNMTTGKTIALSIWTFVGKVMSLFFNMLSRFIIAFLPRSKCLNFMTAVTICSDFEAQENKVCHCYIISPSICDEVIRPDAMILVYWMLNFKPAFPLSSFSFIKRLFSSSLLTAIRVVSSVYLMLWIFFSAVLIPACVSSSLAFLMMYSAHKLNKQGDLLIYCLEILISQFGTNLLFHVLF